MHRPFAVALAGILLVVTGCTTDTIPSPPPSRATASPIAQTSQPDDAVRWQRIDTGLPRCHVTAAIERTSGGIVALCQGPDLMPRVLTSTDGEQWTVATPSGLEPRMPNHVILLNGLTETSSGTLILVGAEALEDLSSGDAAVWISTDGTAWQRAPAAPELADAEINAVISTDSGILAVGADGFPGANVQLPGLRGAAVWQSTDGSSWQRQSSPPRSGGVLLSGIGRTDIGFIAWGDGAPPGSGVVWTSSDGTAWSMATPPVGGHWGPLARVVPVGSRQLAVGTWTTTTSNSDTVTVSGAWTSEDGGDHWKTDVIHGDPTIGPIWDVGVAGSTVLATVPDGNILRSDDGGLTWTLLPRDPALGIATLDHVVATSHGLVAFGSIPTDTGSFNAIWRAVFEAAAS